MRNKRTVADSVVLEEDEISAQVEKARQVSTKRFVRRLWFIFALLCLSGLVHLLRSLFDFPFFTKTVELMVLFLTGLAFVSLISDVVGDNTDILVLEFRLRLKRLDEKISRLESGLQVASESGGEQARDQDDQDDVGDEELIAKYRESAERGETWGQHNLGIVYLNGKRVPKDNAQAAFWFRKAADQGDESAQFLLADLLRRGEGLPPDYTEALRLFQKVIEQKHTYRAAAEYYVAMMYTKGTGVQKDHAEAARYWERAAQHGWRLACYDLGQLYQRGNDDFGQNLEEAYFWYCVGLGNDDPKKVHQYYIDQRDEIARRLAPESLPKIQERAERWLRGERAPASS